MNREEGSARGLQPIHRRLFLPMMIAFALGFSSLAVVVSVNFNTNTRQFFDQGLDLSQRQFVTSIRQEAAMGMNFEVYRKCSYFLEDRIVNAVTVADVNGVSICDIAKTDRKEQGYARSTVIYQDEKQAVPIATAKVWYSSVELEAALISSALFLGLFLVAFSGGMLYFILRVSRRIAQPIEKLSAKLNTAGLDDLVRCQAIFSHNGIMEVEKLFLGCEQLAARVRESEVQLVQQAKHIAIAKTTQMLAHDVRKPFSMLKTAISMMDQAQNFDEIRKILDLVRPELERSMTAVQGMIQDVMEIGSKNPLRTEPVPIRSLISGSLMDVSRIRANSEIEFSYQLGHSHLACVDKNRFLRVFSNIIDNAFQAMSFKGRIWVKTSEEAASERAMITVTIGNSDSYIPEEIYPQLFDAFFTCNKKGGTGLGLAIAHKIVTDHGGTICCRSDRIAGTEFVFSLPADADRDASNQALPVNTREADAIGRLYLEITQTTQLTIDQSRRKDLLIKINRALASEAMPLTLLVIDDETVYIEGLKRLHGQFDELAGRTNIKEARSGTEALSLMDSEEIFAVICDVDLGAGQPDGYEVTSLIRQRQPESYICIHTNRTLPGDYKKAIDCGADSFLPKPMSGIHFLKMIEGALDKQLADHCAAS